MRKKRLGSIFCLLLLVGGLCLLLYPAVSNGWNDLHQTRAIIDYADTLDKMTHEDCTATLTAAEDYNRTIRENSDSGSRVNGYADALNIAGTGMMGVITIEKIGVRIPIYHGTEDGVLNCAVGHLEGSSLPIGGEDTHCVLAEHRGLPGAKLFTELDQLDIGDSFTLSVLGRELDYMVDQILTVLPDDVDALRIEAGQDLCTLVTCTPYGINSHRLLVRGKRTEPTEPAATVTQPPASEPEPETPPPGLPVLGLVLAAAVVVPVVLLLRRAKR